MKKPVLFFVALLLSQIAIAGGLKLSGKVVDKLKKRPLPNASILLQETQAYAESDLSGHYEIEVPSEGTYHLVVFAEGYNTLNAEIEIKTDLNFDLLLETLSIEMEAVEITDAASNQNAMRRLRNVEGMAIYAAKKSEVINLENITANLATNNARQVYKGIAGLNIWENDGSGLQLNIGARGLDPNRTSNFNTRQNGYDISADALGYPESYYTPPTQALRRIEIVRGAASLQYGPQFGGLLNFVLKEGNKKKPFEFFTENTVGSFGLFSTFNSIGGSKKGLNYYAYYQRKQGNGWRENAGFHQNNAFGKLSYQLTSKLKIGAEYTFMNYLSQQPGGLADFEFDQDPRQSKRDRNWFRVNWNLAALTLDYKISDRTKLNLRNFVLVAGRDALGELGPINRPDPLRERDLVMGSYRNFGHELRLIHRYDFLGGYSTFLAGGRYYQGHTRNKQGDADDGSAANFEFLNPNDLEKSDYTFPSRNASFFVENLFNITKRFSLTPGIRFEYIRTASEGFYKQRVFSGGELIFEQKLDESRKNARAFILAGLGAAYHINDENEAYANFSQNYRSINFSDLAVVNPNLLIDPELKDEKGYNMDIGIRGKLLEGALQYDFSAFFLRYQNRIGLGETMVVDSLLGISRTASYRTNIGDAGIIGLETYVEADLWKLFIEKNKTDFSLSTFVNLSLQNGRYLSGQSNYVGNKVELIPPLSIKTGLNFKWKELSVAYQLAYVGKHYTDATNAEYVANATRGEIPSYWVQDLSLSYAYKRFGFSAGVNNLADGKYFTRRAAGYPGPGILPAEGRSFYVGLSVKL